MPVTTIENQAADPRLDMDQRLQDIYVLTYACEILADAWLDLDKPGAPPIQYLLEQANEKIRTLIDEVAG